MIGEANGQALPLAFMFVRSTGEKEDGAKIDLLENFLRQLKDRGILASDSPDRFAHSDKERAEVVSFDRVFLTKRQLCYWHGIKYIRERLAESKAPAFYDARLANREFPFIDPTWAPGVTGGKFTKGTFEEEDVDDAGEPELPLDKVSVHPDEERAETQS